MSFKGDLSFKNRNILEKYKKCSCFYCLKTFETSEITEYVDNNETALCPYCGIDSVVCFENGMLPTKDELDKWYKESFSSIEPSLSEIQKNKNRVFNYTTLDNAKIFIKKESSNLFFLIKEIEINDDSKGFLIYDTKNKKQVVYSKEFFSNNFMELSLEEKQNYYSELKSCWNYRLVYSVKKMRLAVHEFYYPGYSESPSNPLIYLNEVHPQKIKDELLEMFEQILNAFAQPIIIDETENNIPNETSDLDKK
ncbi:hypothetical protein QEJ31_00520 [Pigmentibacter sp. JX0631]|uniref:hypothetical protein n=1 Tax=Pigmentibacter sp. JX0631 TaxID=2976982 RepID=UPI002468260B|nr:hypothetical protein [Pigmentibacter sp. JX0631]WGL60086.1 hypothetical protein QEJ31_00520 [Pigmentibacter sp. JX0631]